MESSRGRGCTFWAKRSDRLSCPSEELHSSQYTNFTVVYLVLVLGLAHRNIDRVVRTNYLGSQLPGDILSVS